MNRIRYVKLINDNNFETNIKTTKETKKQLRFIQFGMDSISYSVREWFVIKPKNDVVNNVIASHGKQIFIK